MIILKEGGLSRAGPVGPHGELMSSGQLPLVVGKVLGEIAHVVYYTTAVGRARPTAKKGFTRLERLCDI
jgi:hypothetical protein